MVGAYVRLSWDTLNEDASVDTIAEALTEAGSTEPEHDIEWAIQHITNANCYEGWEDELRYLMFRYEEHLAREKNVVFDNVQWERIWEASAAQSIEHICPQSKGFARATDEGIFVHTLGNLMLLPPGLNASLQDLEPHQKVEEYRGTGLLFAAEVANMVEEGWDRDQVSKREGKLLEWVRKTWT